MTFSFFRSDKPVYTTVSLRPISPCQPTQAMARPVFSSLWNPHPTFPGEVHNFYGCLYPGLGRRDGDSQISGLDPFRAQAPHQHFGAQDGNFGPPSLGFSFTRPPTYDRYRQHYSCSLYQQTEWNPFPYPVTSSSGSVPMATNSGHSHSHSMFATVHSFSSLCLQSQSLEHRRQMLCHKTGRGGQCSGFHRSPCLAKLFRNSGPTTQEGQVILIVPWWPHNRGFHVYYVFVCTTLSSFHTARIYCHNRDMSRIASCTVCVLGGSHAALPSSRIFEEVSRLEAALRRPSTNRVYNDRWLCFALWAAGPGIDQLGPTAAQIATFLYYLFDSQGLSPQSIKGYRSYLASVLSRTGMAAAVQAKAMSDLIMSMELQRPRMTPVLQYTRSHEQASTFHYERLLLCI